MNWWIAFGVALAVSLAEPDLPEDLARKWWAQPAMIVLAAVAGLLIGHGVS